MILLCCLSLQGNNFLTTPSALRWIKANSNDTLRRSATTGWCLGWGIASSCLPAYRQAGSQ
jgi:hypothetical protein